MNYQTRQRQAVLRVLMEERKPLTAQSVLDRARVLCPGLGVATVFRILKHALEEGEIRKVELPGVAPHYERASQKHHHFFVCQVCSKLLPLEGCVDGLQKLLPPGTRMKNHEVVILGECETCAVDPLE